MSAINTTPAAEARKHSHYFRSVKNLTEIDVYRICDMFRVDDHSGAIQHALKKLLLPGQRGAGKDQRKDIQEAVDTLQRKLQMMDEDAVDTKPAEDGLIDSDPPWVPAAALGWFNSWIEVPAESMRMPSLLGPETNIDYLTKSERDNKRFETHIEKAEGVCWGIPPSSPARIVAYRIA